ncbi:amidase [Enterococcus raffinosus]|uniref:amidase n=1 Tax=Enterococcus raffinosus TaxID=71452 RepID=UPI001C454DCA|nr:amidase [Enterococcus raffinosus]MDT2573979.1 amidase [Enterococcus raffinosus]QXJ60291.1 amidase [Enterococcus raffinosus]
MKDGLYWAELLRKKEISFQELLMKFEERVLKQNSALNAFVTIMDQEALKEYEKLDNILDRPFAGLPIPLKMLGQEKKGWLSTSGSKLLREHHASHSSNFTNQLVANGLIPFAQTNTPEFGFKNITDTQIYGSAKNPWNLDYYSGGSSGGAASAVASGIVPIAGASDGGGSIRIPASFCGLIGLKPTRGVMPVGPSGWRGWQGAAIDFALTVSMRDTEKLFYGMRSIHSAAPYQAPERAWQHFQAAHGKKLRIAVIIDSPIDSPVSDEAIKAVEQARDFLSEKGHQVEMISYPVNGNEIITSYYSMNGAETAAMFSEIEKGMKRPVEKNDMELMTWGIYQYGKKIPASHFVNALNQWDYAAFKMEELFTKYDLLLTPTTAETAPKLSDHLVSDEVRDALEAAATLTESELLHLIDRMFEKSLQITPYTQLANLTGQPAISLPTHVTSEGLPLGIQFTAARGREDLLLQVGKVFEVEYGFKLPEYYQ